MLIDVLWKRDWRTKRTSISTTFSIACRQSSAFVSSILPSTYWDTEVSFPELKESADSLSSGKETSVSQYVLGKMEETKAELCLQAMEKVVEMLVRFVRQSRFQSTSISIPTPALPATGQG